MAYAIVPVDPDDVFAPADTGPTDTGPTDSVSVPEVGPKNVYKNGVAQPQTSTTKTVTIPSMADYTLPKVVDAGAEPAAAKPAFTPTPVDDDDQMVPLSEVYDPKSDYAITRGFKTAFTGAGDTTSLALDMPRLALLPPDQLKEELLKRAGQAADPRNASLQTPSTSDITSTGKFFTWLGESIGQTGGSWLGAATYGGLPGAAAGAGIGAVGGSVLPGAGTLAGGVAGGATGFTAGTMGDFVLQGVGGTLQDLLGDKAVVQGLRDGSIDPKALLGIASGAGAAIGAIDALPAGKFLARIGGKEVSKDVVKELLKKATLKGAARGFVEEGGTEGIQGGISEVTQAITGGDWDTANRLLSVLDQTLAGGVGGAGPGAVAGLREQQKVRAPVGQLYKQAAAEKAAKIAADANEADTALPAGEAAAVSPADADPATTPSTSTPGNLGAGQPVPPANAKPVEPAPPTGQPPIDPDIAAATVGTPAPATDVTVEETPLEEDEEEDAGDLAGTGVLPEQQTDAEKAALADVLRGVLTEQDSIKSAQEKAASTVTVGEPDADLKAAAAATVATPAAAAAPAAAATPVPAAKETLGTGQALGVPAAAAPAIPAASSAPAEVPAALSPPQPDAPAGLAGAAAPALTPAPAPEPTVSLEPAPVAPAAEVAKKVSKRRAPTPAQAVPEPVAAPPQSELIKREEVAAFAPAAEAAPAVQAAPLAEAAKEVSRERKAGTLSIGRKEPVSLTGSRTVLSGAEIKARAAAAAAQAAEARPEAPSPPVAQETPAAPKRTEVSSQVASQIRNDPELTESRHSELPTLHIDDAVEEAAAAAAAAMPKGKSPREIIAELVARKSEIIADAKRRLQPALDVVERELDEADQRTAQRVTGVQKAQKQAKETEKKEAMAAAEKGQQKERAKKGGKSDVGILTEDDKSVRRAAEKNPDDPLLKAWMQVDKEHKEAVGDRRGKAWKDKIKGKTPEEVEALKAEIEQPFLDAKLDIQEQRAAEAEKTKAAEEETKAKQRAATVQKQVREATRDLAPPTVAELGPHQVMQERALVGYLKAFKDAIAGLELGTNISKAGKSIEENLAIYARRASEVIKKRTIEDDIYVGHGPMEFWAAAKNVADALAGKEGAEDAFYDLVGTEKIKGASYNENAGSGDIYADEVAGSEAADAGPEHDSAEATARTAYRAGDSGTVFEGPRKGGRVGATARHQGQVARDPGASWGEVTIYHGGEAHKVEAQTETAASRLRQLLEAAHPGIFSFFRNMHIRRLLQLVGDVPVHVVSRDDMARVLNVHPDTIPGGAYLGYDAAIRESGVRPQVMILDEVYYDPRDEGYQVLLLHELTHAATVQAYWTSPDAAYMIGRMRVALLKELRRRNWTDEQLKAKGVDYGLMQDTSWRSDIEFIAEAFSNPDFQEMLSSFNVPASIRADMTTLGFGGRKLSWWQLFVGAINHAIGMVRGQRGNTYMSQMLRVYPDIMRSSAMQRVYDKREAKPADIARARQERQAMDDRAAAEAATLDISIANLTPLQQLQKLRDELAMMSQAPDALYRRRVDVGAITSGFNERVDSVKEWANSGWGTRTKNFLANTLATTAELQRRAAELFGGTDNPFHRLADVLLRKDPLRGKYRAIGQRHELALMQLQASAEGEAAADFVHESTRHGVDATVPLSHRNNAHISKTGPRSANARAAHAKQAAAFARLSPQARKVISEAAQHYRHMYGLETHAAIVHAVRSVMGAYRTRQKLAAIGKTEADIVKWVESGAAARSLTEQDIADKAFHEALGESGKQLGAITELRKLKGLYFPLARRGAWFVTATEKLATPAGAVADPTSLDGNRFFFPTQKALEDYLGTVPYLAKGSSFWIDPKTTKRTKKTATYTDDKTGEIVVPQQIFVATVQNKRLEMHDNKGVLEKRRDALITEGHKVSQVALTDKMLEAGASDVTPAQLQKLLRNLEQTSAGSNPIGQQAVKEALIDAHVRSMTRPSALQRRIKRKGTLGYDTDMAAAMREYNQSTASHLANIELAHEMSEADNALAKFIEDRRQSTTGTSIEKLQQMRQELHNRFKSQAGASEKGGLSRFSNALMNTSYMRHLFSPHYTIMQMLQPFMTTYPMLAAEYGHAAAWRETIAAYRIGGVRRTLGTGMGETWQATRNLNPYAQARVTQAELEGKSVHDEVWRDLVKDEADAADLLDVFEGVAERGFGASAGIEAGAISERDLSTAEVVLQRAMNVAKGLPEAAEGINRYTAAIASYRLARRKGMTHAAAKAKSILTVEQTQGGYARANNPAFFNNALLRWPLQFKKYGLMYGQMYYGNVAKLVAPSSDPETRKMAAKALARLSATTFVFAGVGGLPFIELARVLANVAMAMGLTDDDWEDWESGMQGWFGDFLKFATGSEGIGERASEAAMHGLTRLINVDTSASLGADNLVTFGQPRNMDEEGVYAWLGKSALGAPGTMGGDIIKAVNEGDYLGAIPWPKLIKNITDSYGLYSEGTVSRETGEQFADPVGIGEAGVKLLGFNPASSARQWESGGSGRTSVEDRQEKHRRTVLMGKWASAKTRGDHKAAQEIFRDDVKAWNKAHKDPKLRIDMGDLYRSRDQRARDRKERERATLH